MSVVPDELAQQIAGWFAARPLGGWQLEVRPLTSLPSLAPTLDSRRRRFDLFFELGPLSNEYPVRQARLDAAALPDAIAELVSEGFLDGLARAYVG